MKWFTEPNGKFVIKIPIEWQYKNLAAGIEEKSPFCFHTYEKANWSFQISCYSDYQLKQNINIENQPAGKPNIRFITSFLGDDEYRTKLWFASLADHSFIIKYVYDVADENSLDLKERLETIENVLSTLQLLPENHRSKAVELDKYDKFMASLAASFDLRNNALECGAVIELIVIIANQIDAYLRMALMLKQQLDEQSDRIDIVLLFQGENDPPMMERAIYKKALSENIISQALFANLELLYKERNKIIHRYIITDFKTRTTYHVAADYEDIAEQVRDALSKVEERQANEKIGIYKAGLPDMDNVPEEEKRLVYSRVNDKHLVKGLSRKIVKKQQK